MAICTQNNVPIGKPDNLADFLRALNSNKHLAMNFWAMVARCEKDHTHPGDSDWLLNAIVEGVTGRTVAELDETGPNATLMVVKLSSVLAGEDVPLTPFPPAPARELDDPAEAGRWARASVPAQVAPIASRQQQPEPTRPRRSEAAPPVERITNPAWLNDGSLRLVLQPEPASREGAAEQEVPITIPLSAYADDNPQRTVSAFWLSATLATVVLVFGFWFVLHRNPQALANLAASLRASYSSVTARLNHTNSPEPASAGNAANPLPAAASPSAIPGPAPAPTPSASPAIKQDAPTSVPASPSASQPAQPIAPTAETARSSSDSTPTPARSRSADRDTPDATDSASTSDTNARVVVPETLMRQNLISSRVPIYPDTARGSHIEGLVVMHAVITAKGTVEDLHVIQGDPSLRQAAIDAASAWRYRPYTLSGRPVDVSTTLTVDFSSRRTPTAATPIPMQ
jgi:TonB family protein